MIRQLHLFYFGRVQGVGFRYAVLQIAHQQKVCGWVMNLDNGQVEIMAYAEEEALNNLLQEINQQFSSYIKDLKIEWLPACQPEGELSGFEIKF